VSCIGQEKNIRRILVGRPEGKRPLGRHGQRLENSVRMDIKSSKVEQKGLDSFGSGRHKWHTLVYMVMNLQVP